MAIWSTMKSSLLLTAFVFVTSGFAASAQNLVPNPSFENANCPTGYNGTATQVAMYLSDWYSATCASPDPMTNCSSNANTSVPSVWFGHQNARTGTNYMGFSFYSVWYEYIGVKLTQPLAAGTTYDVSFYVSCADQVKYASDKLGIFFSDTAIQCISGFSGPVLTYTPQVQSPSGVFYTDTAGWSQVSGSFTATGGEQYIVIGYFNPWNTAALQDIGGANARCYYYIDDVSVTPAPPIPAQPGSIGGLQTVCENSTQTFSVNPVAGATSYTWTLPSGWTGTSTTHSITVTVGGTSGNVSVTANNSSGSSTPRTVAVTVNTFPGQPGTVSGPPAVCEGAVVGYSIPPVAGADSYFWTLPSGWSGASNTTNITVTAGTAGGMLIAGAQNGCGTSGAQVAVTVTVPNVSVSQNNGQLAAVSGSGGYQWLDCSDGFSEIVGETQPVYTPDTTGSYAVEVTQNGCIDTSACLNITVTPAGIHENGNNNGMAVFPNPAREYIQIIFADNIKGEIRFALKDVNGKTLLTGNKSVQQENLYIILPPGLANGIYLLQIGHGENIFYNRIVVDN